MSAQLSPEARGRDSLKPTGLPSTMAQWVTDYQDGHGNELFGCSLCLPLQRKHVSSWNRVNVAGPGWPQLCAAGTGDTGPRGSTALALCHLKSRQTSLILCMNLNFTFCKQKTSQKSCIFTSIGLCGSHGHFHPPQSQGYRTEV